MTVLRLTCAGHFTLFTLLLQCVTSGSSLSSFFLYSHWTPSVPIFRFLISDSYILPYLGALSNFSSYFMVLTFPLLGPLYKP
jgi:hypothetical protein